MFLSAPAAAIVPPSGLRATVHRGAVASVIARCSSDVVSGHRRIAPSSPPDAACRPSGRIATAVTWPAWPWNDHNSLPVAASQTRTVLSSLPEARSFPPGPAARALTLAECPVYVRRVWPTPAPAPSG